jgi:hypothetical protein
MHSQYRILPLQTISFRSSVSTNYKTNPLCHSLSTQKTIVISHTIFSQAQHGKEIRFSSAAILDKSWSTTKSMLSSTCNQFSGQELQLNLGMSFFGNLKNLFSMHNIRLWNSLTRFEDVISHDIYQGRCAVEREECLVGWKENDLQVQDNQHTSSQIYHNLLRCSCNKQITHKYSLINRTASHFEFSQKRWYEKSRKKLNRTCQTSGRIGAKDLAQHCHHDKQTEEDTESN